LAIDTSTEVLSLSLSVDGSTWQAEIDAGTRHSELMMEWIDKLTGSAGLDRGQLQLIICMKGPGSFTGLRIGYAAAKGLSAALGIPVIAVPTLDCIAFSHSEWPGIVMPVIDAKKNCFFAAFYRGGKRLTDYLDSGAQDLVTVLDTLKLAKNEPLFVTGPGTGLFIGEIPEFAAAGGIVRDRFPSRGRSAEMLHFREILQIPDNFGILDYREGLYSGPLYIRKSDAELSLDK